MNWIHYMFFLRHVAARDKEAARGQTPAAPQVKHGWRAFVKSRSGQSRSLAELSREWSEMELAEKVHLADPGIPVDVSRRQRAQRKRSQREAALTDDQHAMQTPWGLGDGHYPLSRSNLADLPRLVKDLSEKWKRDTNITFSYSAPIRATIRILPTLFCQHRTEDSYVVTMMLRTEHS